MVYSPACLILCFNAPFTASVACTPLEARFDNGTTLVELNTFERERGRENCFVFSERQGMVCGPDINATASREAREAASQCFRLITLFSQENWSITMIKHPRSQIGYS